MSLVNPGFRTLGAVALCAALSACTEKLESETGCPLLCNGQGAPIQNITIEPVVSDTTLPSTLATGAEIFLPLVTRGDTADTRAIVRFDSIPSRYQRTQADTATTAITTVDSATVRFRIDLRGSKIPGPVTIEAYDVDTAATSLLDVASLFRASRLVGSRTVAAADLKDSVRIPLSSAFVLAKAQTRSRIRLGFRAVSTAGVQFSFFSSESGAGAQLRFRVAADTLVQPLLFSPRSSTPAADSATRAALGDYLLIVRAPASGPRSAINIGGIPGSLSYLRFSIPKSILDSSVIVRASLILTQRANLQLSPLDSVTVLPLVSTATENVTDLIRASQITADFTLVPIDSLRFPVREEKERTFEIAHALQAWRALSIAKSPLALVLRATTEGSAPAEAFFHSIESAPALRPRLLISYTSRAAFGRP